MCLLRAGRKMAWFVYAVRLLADVLKFLFKQDQRQWNNDHPGQGSKKKRVIFSPICDIMYVDKGTKRIPPRLRPVMVTLIAA
jgi:hypothetical protein